ncbi:excitatory amino acid transporter-like [Mizuhopecten yessoensis]|uniref:Amino acid transporter n=1 Tax=Mizuhopecten yessoensis TaxID=6573 RepID=A0A210QEK4_MIZYE|nr:excitatory amino acid transporter-like [Mizuhopecten yessoensis]OWF47182.1 Excitatory amino acid transporter [Mizuhopecten yessoensis]
MIANRKISPIRRWMKDNLIIVLPAAGIVLGFAFGFGIRESKPSTEVLTWIGMPGELFLRMLKLMVIPFIVSSVITATASLNAKSNGRISIVSITFIVLTNSLSCVVAIALVLIMKPGDGVRTEITQTGYRGGMETADVFADLFRNIMPDNIVDMMFQQTLTRNHVTNGTYLRNTTNGTVEETVRKINKIVGKTSGTNLLGIIMTCLLLGIAINKAEGKGKPVLDFFESLTGVIMIILQWLLRLTPVGILSLIAVTTATIKDLGQDFRALGMYVGLMTVGISMHQLIIMPTIFFVFTRRNPYRFAVQISKAWMMVFATTSTAMAIPEMLSACENHQNVDRRVSRFVVPLCVALNANGSAMFITSAAIFVGTVAGIDLNVGDIILIGILTAVCVMALPPVPSASLVALVMILTSMNIPADSISLLFAVEWYLDRIRSSSNLVSHTHCVVVTYHFCKKSLEQSDVLQDIEDDNKNVQQSC